MCRLHKRMLIDYVNINITRNQKLSNILGKANSMKRKTKLRNV